jgi:Xaa-Pro dipeptidase
MYPKEPLLKNMCLTVEPGIYFNPVAIAEGCADPIKRKYLVTDVIKQYEGFGGVRIEDDIVITDTGCEVLTNVPRDIEEIEALMNVGGN